MVVTTTKSGLGAVEVVKNKYFDLILMDKHMLRMDGLGAAKHIRSDSEPKIANIPVFALIADVTKVQYKNIGMNV